MRDWVLGVVVVIGAVVGVLAWLMIGRIPEAVVLAVPAGAGVGAVAAAVSDHPRNR